MRLFDAPAIPMSIAAGLVLATLAAAGIVAAKRFIPAAFHRDGSTNNIANMMLSVFSAFYGILLGLLAVGAYENINSVGEVLANESSAMAVLYYDFEGFPQSVRDELQNDLRAYAQELVDHSYPQQALGEKPTAERKVVRALFDTIASFEPKSPREQQIQGEALRQMGVLQSARTDRLSNLDIGIPPMLWWIVGLGAAITLVLVCLLDFPIKTHLVFGCLLAFFIGAMISVIGAMDNPFSGAEHVGAERIQELLDATRPR